jgi:UDP-N-acetylglucosamine/UDP-N-acetylgalactosamine diphosphorylase
LTAELASIDWRRVKKLVEHLVLKDEDPAERLGQIEPIDVVRLPRTSAEEDVRSRATAIGLGALRAGRVAILLVAGGQGTRLGYEGPKGTYPVGPVSGASLFQIHAEKVRAIGKLTGRTPPFFIMTSPENDGATRRFFEENGHFGLPHVRFFIQHGRLPMVDRTSGRVLLEDRGRLAAAPDGHGGTIAALAHEGTEGTPSCLEEMKALGCDTVHYFQVDNPLVKVGDPSFLGLHLENRSDVSFKVVAKRGPEEKVGVVVREDGKPKVIEYMNMPRALAEARNADGSLVYWEGSIAIHVFDRSFLERVAREACLPMHRAFKKVAYLDESGDRVEPEKPNAAKFESFIFDALPLAERYTIVETDRAAEFAPLKNLQGEDSVITVRQGMSELFASWLEQAGAKVPRGPDGGVSVAIEISPLFATSASELAEHIPPGLVVSRPLYLA